jgi:hypothetical protein
LIRVDNPLGCSCASSASAQVAGVYPLSALTGGAASLGGIMPRLYQDLSQPRIAAHQLLKLFEQLFV